MIFNYWIQYLITHILAKFKSEKLYIYLFPFVSIDCRLPESTENNVLPSKPPCSGCFMIKNESALNQHKSEAHSETPPFVCKECFLELNSWYKYVQHMKMHLKYAAKCNECIYHMHHKSSNVIFLCHVCNLSFESDDQLTIHINTHLENGQNEGSLD